MNRGHQPEDALATIVSVFLIGLALGLWAASGVAP